LTNIINILKSTLSIRTVTIIKWLYYNLIKRKLAQSSYHYRFSDEDLKYTHLLEAVNYIRVAGDDGNVLPQTYFEFGCHSGRTFSSVVNAANYLKLNNFKCFAFDSFEGLPATQKNEDGYFEGGTFNTSLKDFKKIIKQKTGIKIPPEQLIKGFYENSLTKQLKEELPCIGLLHIDVDLYSSTKTILNFVKPLLVDGGLILFDDYYCFKPTTETGEKRALNEFLRENTEIEMIPWKAYSTFGQSYFVKIKSK